jgi:hypothetical protein
MNLVENIEKRKEQATENIKQNKEESGDIE